ncbi:MAG: glycolate oxidase subunit GlcD [Candidatus Bathyarchaeota archaeon BA2]|nr:MAG: glycolate oxidase subunit GlcD [Candidatus Bathyarchaeota archaeon BA2]
MSYIERQLIDIVGSEHVSSDLADLVPYERDDQFALVPPHRPDFVVKPSTRDEVQAIIRLANRYRIPVVPLAAGINRKGLCIPTEAGILLDLRRMNRILEVNEEMMTATIEPGVTFGQLVQEVSKTNLRVITPWAPSTVSVLANYMLRGIYGPATRYGTDHLITIEVILPNGDILQTGSAATPKGMPYCGIVNGPDLCKLFQANPGNLGVLTKGTLRLYPKPEVIKPLMTSHPNYEAMVEPAIKMTKQNLVAACWTMMFSRSALKTLTEGSILENFVDLLEGDFYTMWLYVEGDRGQAEADEKAVRKLVEGAGGTVLPIPHETEEEMIKDHVWGRTTVRGWKKGSLYGCSFYGVMKHAPKYYEATYKISLKYGFDEFHYEAVPVAPFHGQLAYNDPCILWDSGNPSEVKRIRKLHKELMKALLDVGIYGWFRPFPGVVDAAMLGKYGELWREIKRLIDPNNIMNPGKPPL